MFAQHMCHLQNKFPLLLGLLLIGQMCFAHAEKADRDKPIQIDSNRMSLDNAKRISIFEGKVELTQGTLQVFAEKVVVTEDEAGHKFCVATGHLASFRQRRDLANEYVEGYGERIEYNTLSEKIDLFVRARVKRAQDDVRGDHITYSTQTEIFRVNSPDQTGRVRATLQPQNNETKIPAKGADQKPGETKIIEPKVAEPQAAQSGVTGTKTIEPKVSEVKLVEPIASELKLAAPVTPETKLIEPITSEPSPALKQPEK